MCKIRVSLYFNKFGTHHDPQEKKTLNAIILENIVQ